MGVLLYWIGVRLYALAVHLAAPFIPKARAAVQGRRGRWKRLEAALGGDSRPVIWMHCASLGEFEQGRPVLEALRRERPECALLLTFFSPSGYMVRKDWPGADYVYYLPFDGPRAAARWVRTVRPALAIFVKYEFWYFHLRALQRAGVPTILVSAVFRKGQPFFRGWGRVHRRMLHRFQHIFVQRPAHDALLRGIGFETSSVAGDTRFDRVSDTAALPRMPAAETLAQRGFLVVAGSTWPPDETLLAEALAALPLDATLLLAPHEVDAAHLAAIEAQFAPFGPVRWSEWERAASESGPTPRVVIVDCVGMLTALYGSGQVAYVGGGFGRGIHNVLEPAAHGLPVIFGPRHAAFPEAADLLSSGAAAEVESASALAARIREWMTDDAARQAAGRAAAAYVQDGKGATALVMAWLDENAGQ